MKDNIRLELERGAKLDDIEKKSGESSRHGRMRSFTGSIAEMLSDASQQFVIGTKKLKQTYWWKNVKVRTDEFIDAISGLNRVDVDYSDHRGDRYSHHHHR